MILTSARVICINRNNSAFKAFDLPLNLISNEGFEQPIFGANYLKGSCKPLLNSLPGIINFKIWLMNGGCGTLAPAYLRMVASCKRNRGRGAEQSVINSYQNGGKKTAYIDPNDPSVIYLQQPEVAGNINYNPLGYQPVAQSEPMQIHPNQPIPQPQQIPNQNNYYPNYPNQNPNYPNQKPNYANPNPNYTNPNPNYANPNPNYPNPNYTNPNPNYTNPNPNYANPNINNNINNIPPQNNNQNNPYPIFDLNRNNTNSNGQVDLPSEEEIFNNGQNNAPPAYPSQGMEGLNEVINNQQQEGGKYFGFWGPNLDRNPNYNNNNNNNGH